MQFLVEQNEKIARDVYRMRLSGDTSAIARPGQFVNLMLDGFYLRRPISVCDWDAQGITIIYKVVGKGTAAMAHYQKGQALDLLTGLGNGYNLKKEIKSPLLVGGGVGVPPLYGLAKEWIKRGIVPTVILGFNAQDEVFYEQEFLALGAKVIVCTADGSYGLKGFATTPMQGLDYDYLFACGPEPMLRAVDKASGDIPGQLSFESRMGCGFGACMGCSCQTLTMNKRICLEGPVMRKGEILWPT
ncbi:dihydroorotate dehydrogenase electron transfer subunit [Eubacteriales bacterium OttesenSCG-928-N13]|nr:dihydroorotate dehydrogenase electron transfer subunit [Eubacteriales bacterium OttesenSCG-928-N13]